MRVAPVNKSGVANAVNLAAPSFSRTAQHAGSFSVPTGAVTPTAGSAIFGASVPPAGGRQAVSRSVQNNEVISGACKGDFGDRPPTEIAFSTLSPPAFGSARAKAATIAEYSRHHPVPAPLIGPHNPPVNIVGGYRFPGAAAIDLSPVGATASYPAPALEDRTDLEIPVFLRRIPESSK